MVKQTLVFDGGGGGEEEGLPKHLISNQIKNKNTKTIKKGREYTRHASTGGGGGARLEFKSFKLHVYITTVNTIYSYHFVKLRVVADLLNCKNVSSPLSFLLARHIIIERMFRT